MKSLEMTHTGIRFTLIWLMASNAPMWGNGTKIIYKPGRRGPRGRWFAVLSQNLSLFWLHAYLESNLDNTGFIPFITTQRKMHFMLTRRSLGWWLGWVIKTFSLKYWMNKVLDRVSSYLWIDSFLIPSQMLLIGQYCGFNYPTRLYKLDD